MTDQQLRLLLLDQLFHSTPHFHYRRRRDLVLNHLLHDPVVAPELSVLRAPTLSAKLRVLRDLQRNHAVDLLQGRAAKGRTLRATREVLARGEQ